MSSYLSVEDEVLRLKVVIVELVRSSSRSLISDVGQAADMQVMWQLLFCIVASLAVGAVSTLPIFRRNLARMARPVAVYVRAGTDTTGHHQARQAIPGNQTGHALLHAAKRPPARPRCRSSGA